ncbi:uncharacterized protein LOC131856823 [Cryptomeria japonica]|uniref:uncharacterized protein LOC131856823 n=1 Tax=Cryptomeria japonica TaxID=3369 RepID=UPI0027DA3584|nr:uncharacterized protein LOC131856823 [Cryptomeria japonica]
MQTEEPFQMWGVDFIGKIAKKSSGGHKWILVAIDYFTKWVEAIPTRQATSKVVTKFLLENILIRFGVPHKIVVDNGMYFISKEFANFCESYGITLSHLSPYHHQGNGQPESSNKNLLKIIKRILGNNKSVCDSKLNLAVWADRVTIKKSTRFAPYQLVYGKEARLPLNNLLPVYKFVSEEYLEDIVFMEDGLI